MKWLGYPALHNSWEPEQNVQNAKDEVGRYWVRVNSTSQPSGRAERRRATRTDGPTHGH